MSARLGIRCGALVNLQAHGANKFGERATDACYRLIKRNIFVMTRSGLCRGRENSFRQPLRFSKARREGNPADFSGAAIILPSGAGQVATHDALNRQGLRFLTEHRAAGKLCTVPPALCPEISRQQNTTVANVAKQIKPKQV